MRQVMADSKPIVWQSNKDWLCLRNQLARPLRSRKYRRRRPGRTILPLDRRKTDPSDTS